MDSKKKLFVFFQLSIAPVFNLGVVVSLLLIFLLTFASFPWFNTLSYQNYPSSPVKLEPDRGNSPSNNTTSNGSSLSYPTIKEPRFGEENGGNLSSVEKNSNDLGHAGGNGSSIVEKLPSWNSAINHTRAFSPNLYNTTSISSDSTTELDSSKGNITFPDNSGNAFFNANYTKENISLEEPDKIDALLDKERIFDPKDQERNLSYGSLQNEPCDIFDGKWVRDNVSDLLYTPGSCPYIDDFDCFKNGRPDHDFLKWRWQPNRCNIPRLNATDFLQRLRGKRLLFVGDSLSRNTWQSLVCILHHGVSDKSRVFRSSRKKHFKIRSYYSFRFEDYKCNVDYVRSMFLVKKAVSQTNDGFKDEKLRLDLLDETAEAYRNADVIVFNTGHWWNDHKTSKGINFYQEGDHVYPTLKVLKAYKKALMTWARWIDANINPEKTQVVFRGYSPTHFKGGQWNSGGKCHKENEPIFDESFLSPYPLKMRAFEQVLRKMKTPVIYLNISRLTDYRKDAHPSIYRKRYNTLEEEIEAEKFQDCSHWCLPGVPDSWNELLYASLLQAGKGSWRN